MGTAIAHWFGLRTFAVAKLDVQPDDEIRLGHGRMAQPGPAIAFRAEAGGGWGGSIDELRALTNPGDVARLVILDTWLRNCDRHPADLNTRKPNHDNVFLSAEAAPPATFHLTAIDHTHCFCCGRTLDSKLARIDNVKDARIYGLFPEFVGFLDSTVIDGCLTRLAEMNRPSAAAIVDEIEPEWQVSADARNALVDLIVDRAAFLCGTIRALLLQ